MKSKQKNLIVLILFVLTLCLIAVFSIVLIRGKTTIPDEVSTTIENYMDAFKLGTAYSEKYAHFEDNFIKEAYVQTGDKLLDYKIKNAEKINDNLYAFTILGKTEQSTFYAGDVYNEIYNFVGYIGNKWYFITNIDQIPSDIQAHLDITKYQYNDKNIVDRDDVIGSINVG